MKATTSTKDQVVVTFNSSVSIIFYTEGQFVTDLRVFLISYAEGHFVVDLPVLFLISYAIGSSVTDLTFLFPIYYAEYFLSPIYAFFLTFYAESPFVTDFHDREVDWRQHYNESSGNRLWECERHGSDSLSCLLAEFGVSCV